MPASCGPGAYDHGPSHYQTVISAKGRYDFDNNSVVSPNLVDWLNSLQGSAEVPDTN